MANMGRTGSRTLSSSFVAPNWFSTIPMGHRATRIPRTSAHYSPTTRKISERQATSPMTTMTTTRTTTTGVPQDQQQRALCAERVRSYLFCVRKTLWVPRHRKQPLPFSEHLTIALISLRPGVRLHVLALKLRLSS
jgi:hypothetical protein